MLARAEGSLIPAYRRMHERGLFPGYTLEPHVSRITKLVGSSGAKTLLDYGCGQGFQYSKKHWHEAWGIMPTLYDPAVKEFSAKPKGQFDGVICSWTSCLPLDPAASSSSSGTS